MNKFILCYSVLMLWLWLSLISVIIFTSLNLLFRVMAVKSINPRIFSFVFNCWGAFFTFLIFLFESSRTGLPDSIPTAQIILIILACIFFGLYERTHFLARKHIEASTVTIIFRLTPAVAFFGSIILFGEVLTLNKFLGTMLIIGATILVSYKNSKLIVNNALWIAVFSALVLGMGWMLDKPASVNMPPSLYGFLIWFLPLPIIAFPKLPKIELMKEIKNAGAAVVLIALINATGTYTHLKALSLADASRVIPIASSTAILTVLAGIFILNEKSYLWRKLIAGTMMFGGILLLK